jgi:multidrug efflux pump subunit AcrA (membrane-fusion protein)
MNTIEPVVHDEPQSTTRPGHTGATPAKAVAGAKVMALQAHALAHESHAAAAQAVVGELATQLSCERVSLALYRHGRLQLVAMSGQPDIDARQAAVRAVVAAMDEAMAQRCLIVYPLPPGCSPTVAVAHAALAPVITGATLCSVPVLDAKRPLGALLFERRHGFDAEAIALARDAADFVAPVLALRHRLEHTLAARLRRVLAPGGDGRGLFRLSPTQLAVLATLALVAAAAAVPGSFRVAAPARVEGVGQRVIAAPVDGFVHAAPLRPGASVKEGELLLALNQDTIALERDKWRSEVAQLEKHYRDALSKDDAALIVIGRSKLDQAQAQLDLAMLQLERMQLKAPFDGVLLAGDWSQAQGAPVKRGQELMTMAPSQGYRVVVEVAEQDVAPLRLGQSVQLLFGAFAQQTVTATVTRVAPVASVVDGRNVFEVDADITDAADASLRPGLRGVARIAIEERSWGWVWWHRASQWARRTWWQLLS